MKSYFGPIVVTFAFLRLKHALTHRARTLYTVPNGNNMIKGFEGLLKGRLVGTSL